MTTDSTQEPVMEIKYGNAPVPLRNRAINGKLAIEKAAQDIIDSGEETRYAEISGVARKHVAITVRRMHNGEFKAACRTMENGAIRFWVMREDGKLL